MAYNDNINPGSPPLLWSSVQEAFTKINENFDILVATIGDGSGLAPLAFESLDTNISPATDNLYNIGDATHHWKSIHLGEYSDIDSINGIWLGTAHIKGIGYTVDLPAGTTVDGLLIKDPGRTFFKEIQVDNNFSIVAIDGSNSFGLNSGTAITLGVDSASETITINNNGVVAATAGTGISVSSATGNVTFTNTGVTSLTNTTALPSGRTQGVGINVSTSTGGVALTNTGVLSVEPGSAALIVSTDAATGIVTITNAAPAGNAFRYVTTNGLSGSPLEANSVNGVLNFLTGQGITLSQNAGTDTVTFTIDPVFDLTGSVFADNSSIMVDAVDGVFYGDLFGNVTGNVIGNVTGNVIGNADTATTATTVTLIATDSTAAVHYLAFVDTATGNKNVRTDTSLTYDPSTNILTAGTFSGNVTGAVTGNIFTTLIDSADSSAITVTPKTIFSSDVDIENELIVNGSRVINLAQLKSIAAASADFTEFKTAIAALV